MIRLTLPLPPSANHYKERNRNGSYRLSAEATAFKQEVAYICNAWGVEPFEGDVVVSMCVYRKHKRGDLENNFKVLLDSLQGFCYQNDKQIVEIHAYQYDDKHNPRVEVEVREKYWER